MCPWQSFKATCREDEVILMTSALYGRMRQGECLREMVNYMGCSAEVIGVLDKACSGRHKCQFQIPSPELDEFQPCSELKSYLEASYTCVKGQSKVNQMVIFQSCFEPKRYYDGVLCVCQRSAWGHSNVSTSTNSSMFWHFLNNTIQMYFT